MAAPTLVDADYKAGQELLRLLDQKQMALTTAAWIYDSETQAWSLLLGVRTAKRDLLSAYADISRWLALCPDLKQRIGLDRINVVAPDDPLLLALETNGAGGTVMPLALRSNVVNGIYLGDAVIYRLAA